MATLKKLLKDHGVWVEKNADRIEARELRLLEECLPRLAASRLDVADSLAFLATVYGTKGLVKVGGEDLSGWDEIAHSLDLLGWSCRIRNDQPRVNWTNYLSRIASLACCSSTWSREASLLLARVSSTPGALDSGFWESRTFEPFVLSLCEVGRPTNQNQGAYQEVAFAWDDPGRLVRALKLVCDYHTSNNTDRRSWNAEFRFAPFDLLPCEVMFVRRAKEGQGQNLPTVEHDLVAFLQAPSDLVGKPSELLQRVELAYVEVSA